MQVTMKIPDGLFASPKSPAQVAREVREAVAMYWLARGEISPEQAKNITAEEINAPRRDLREVLLAMPEVGEDADFERLAD
jgi:hypothetical protein